MNDSAAVVGEASETEIENSQNNDSYENPIAGLSTEPFHLFNDAVQ